MYPPNFKQYAYSVALTALLTGCGAEPELPTLHPQDSQSEALLATGSTQEWLNQSTSKRRFIGVKKTGSDTPCPPAGQPFQTSPLFGDGDNNPDNTGWAMGNFCLYEASQDQQLVDVDGDGVLDLPDALRNLLCTTTSGTIGVTNNHAQHCLEAIGPDRFAVGGHAAANPKGQLATVMAPMFEQEFLDHSGHVTDFPASQYDFQTRLSFLDTSRTEGTTGLWPSYRRWLNRNSDHGLMMTRIGEKFACDDSGNCMANVYSQLAMPYKVQYQYELNAAGAPEVDGFGVKKVSQDGAGNDLFDLVEDQQRGGHLGTIAYLAQAVSREVAAWESDMANTGDLRQRMVINLSLAWMPEYGGEVPANYNAAPVSQKEAMRFDWPADVQAAFVAIRDARCQGALIIAASGNTSGGSSSDGPMFPAAWEEVNTPSQSECYTHRYGQLLTTNTGVASSGSEPHAQPGFGLVYAVSGITRSGSDLRNQRTGARTRFTAYADHATLRDFREPWAGYFTGTENALHIKPHTGTSVSSALVATVAAAVWSYRPGLSADELMQAIYATGENISDSGGANVEAQFCHNGAAACGEDAKRITMCRAIFGLDSDNDGFADLTGETTESSIDGKCPNWEDLLASTPSAFVNALPAEASAVGAIAIATPASSFETASTTMTHIHWPKSKSDVSCGNGSDASYPWSKNTGSWQQASQWCPEQQFYTSAAAPWTVPQPEGGGSDCGGACSMFPSYGLVALSGNMDLGTVASPTLSITTSTGTTSNFSLSGLSGFNMTMSIGSLSSMGSISSASFGGSTGSYSFSTPLYIGF